MSSSLNIFDASVIEFFQRFAHKSWLIDTVLVNIASSPLFKGCISVAMLCWAWAQPGPKQDDNRQIILCTLIGAGIAIVFGRILPLWFPFRLRPIHNPDIDFQYPYSVTYDVLRDWSAFPSDQAMMFFSLVTGMFLISRRLGLIALVHVTIVIGILRVYLGYHHPTDILGGALFGAFFTWLATRERVRDAFAVPLLRWGQNHPGAFYGGLSLVLYQFASSAQEISKIAHQIVKALSTHT